MEEAAKTALVAINDLPSSLERQCEVQNLAKLPHCSLILTPEEVRAIRKMVKMGNHGPCS